MVAYACNTKYSEDRDKRIMVQDLPWSKQIRKLDMMEHAIILAIKEAEE
jgi:hypothetical protein